VLRIAEGREDPRIEGSWTGLPKLIEEDSVACNGIIVLNQHYNLISIDRTRFFHKEKAPRSRLIMYFGDLPPLLCPSSSKATNTPFAGDFYSHLKIINYIKITASCLRAVERFSIIYYNKPISITYDHRLRRTRKPVRSSLYKPQIDWRVVGSVTTSEHQLMYVFVFFHSASFRISITRPRKPPCKKAYRKKKARMVLSCVPPFLSACNPCYPIFMVKDIPFNARSINRPEIALQ